MELEGFWILVILSVICLFLYIKDRKMNKEIKFNKKKVENDSQKKNDNSLLEVVTGHLIRKNLRYWISDNNEFIRIPISDDYNENYDCYLKFFDDDRYLVFGCEVVTDIPDKAVQSTCEIITRINQYYHYGHLKFYIETRNICFTFEMINSEKELSFKNFEIWLDVVFNGAKTCRPVISKVEHENVEPFLAMMNLGKNEEKK